MSRLGNTVIQILRDAARDQRCIRCAGNPETVVGAHYTGKRRAAYGGGLGRKVHDLIIAHLCSQCHVWIDQLARAKHADDEDYAWLHSEEFQHLILMTIIRLYEQGILIVKGQRK